MASRPYEQLLEEAERLPKEEQRLIIERLSECLRAAESPAKQRPRWEDYAGSAPSPLCGEDAQGWVSRTREESDQGRSTP